MAHFLRGLQRVRPENAIKRGPLCRADSYRAFHASFSARRPFLTRYTPFPSYLANTPSTVLIRSPFRPETRNFGWWTSSAAKTPEPATPSAPSPVLTLPDEPIISAVDPTATAASTSPEVATEFSNTLSASPSIESFPIDLDLPINLATGLPANGEHIGDLAALGLSASSYYSPIGLIQTLIEQAHVNVGLSWFWSIVLVATAARLLLVRILVKAQVNNARLAAIRPELDVLMAKVKAAKDAGDSLTTQKLALKSQQLFKEHDCHPLASMKGPLVQLPTAIIFFLAIKNMCNLPVETMKTGGTLWFTDLTLPDPYYILPILTTGSMLAMMRMTAKDSPQTTTTAHMSNFFTFLGVGGTAVLVTLPSGMLSYFAVNSLFLIIQSSVLRVPALRTRLGLPPITRQQSSINITYMDTLREIPKYFSNLKDQAVRDAASRATAYQDEARFIPQAQSSKPLQKRRAK